jgi:uncharacterized protein (DUF433 family)
VKAPAKPAPRKRVELGRYIVADSGICHGKPTFKGSRVMVWQVLRAVARGEPWEKICAAWPHAVTHEAIAEALALASRVFADARAVPAIARAAHRALLRSALPAA